MFTTTNLIEDSKSWSYRLEQLTEEVNNHPNKSELLELITEQLKDDNYKITDSCTDRRASTA